MCVKDVSLGTKNMFDKKKLIIVIIFFGGLYSNFMPVCSIVYSYFMPVCSIVSLFVV